MSNVILRYVGNVGQHFVREVSAEVVFDISKNINQARVLEVSAVGNQLLHEQAVLENIPHNLNNNFFRLNLDDAPFARQIRHVFGQNLVNCYG